MGFYGNITNTSRTQFQFDRVYTSRKQMDDSAAADGIYAGRYVLVNYEEAGASDYYVHAYKTVTGTGFQFGPTLNEEGITRFKWIDEINNATDPSLYIVNYIQANVPTKERYADLQPLYTKNNSSDTYTLDQSGVFDSTKTYYIRKITVNEDVVYEGQIIAIPPDHIHNQVNLNATEWEFWKCSGYAEVEGVKYATFIQYYDMYSINYDLDVSMYGTSRGYDSTVWQKTYQNGQDKYVMIAELNTIVPTFDIEADAPKMVPLTPHFDADSTNVYYKLHWSPSWGFRVKAANPSLLGPILNDYGEMAGNGTVAMRVDGKSYPSDETTVWYNTAYDGKKSTTEYIFTVDSEGNRGKWIPVDPNLRVPQEITPRVVTLSAETYKPSVYYHYNQSDSQYYLATEEIFNPNLIYYEKYIVDEVIETPAAIYYNKDGFDPTYVSYGYIYTDIEEDQYKPYAYYKQVNGNYVIADDLEYNEEEDYYIKVEDHIQLTPTGRSGHMYNRHDGSITDSVQEDTQELSIMLPAIGNTIAAVWDLIYGGEEINDGPFRNLDISWERARAGMDRHGLRLVTDYDFTGEYLYQTKNVETIAGAINSVHDLMGMIITSASNANLTQNINSLDVNRIYYDEDLHTFNRKHLEYNYTDIANTTDNYTFTEIDITEHEYMPGMYYIRNGNDYEIDNRSDIHDVTYYVKRLNAGTVYTKVTTPFSVFDGSLYAYQDFTGADEHAYAFQKQTGVNQNTYEPNKYYILINDFYVLDDTPRYRDGIDYYLQTNRIDPLKLDYVRDPKFYRDKTYYNWDSLTKRLYPDLSDEYQKNRFYYRNGQGNYMLAQDEKAKTNVQYFVLNPENVKPLNELFSVGQNYGVYVPGKYLYEEPANSGNYKIDTSLTVTTDRTYWLLSTSEQTTINNQVYARTVTFTKIPNLNADNYVKNTYYLWTGQVNAEPQESSDESQFMLCQDLEFDTLKTYYMKNETLTLINNQYYQVDASQSYSLLQFHENEFFRRDSVGNYIALTRLSDVAELTTDVLVLRKEVNSRGTYELFGNDFSDPTVSAMTMQDQFYEPGKFFYETDDYQLVDVAQADYAANTYYLAEVDPEDGTVEYVLDDSNSWSADKVYYKAYTDYILDTYPTKTHDEYFRITGTGNPVDFHFFEPYKYYRKVSSIEGDEYVLITEDTPPANEDIYERNAVYVIEDSANVYKRGAVWGFKTPFIPASITLATRTEHFALEPLLDFARDINTMHGLILKTRAMLEFDNQDTRDLNTVQGALNTLGDKIAQLDTWVPAQPIVADNYGRLHGAQKVETEWTRIEIDPKVTNPGIKVVHKFNPITSTTHTTDLRTTSANDTSFTEVHSLSDETGHEVGTHTETIYFPRAYGQVTADDNNTLLAGFTYAPITFGGGDDWISTSAAETNSVQKISIAHSNPITDGATAIGPVAGQSPSFGNSFNIPAFAIDDKGHVATSGVQTVTLPDMSVTSANNSTTDSVLTTLSYTATTGAFTTTSIAPNSLVLTGYTYGATVADVAATDTLGAALSKLEARGKEAKTTADAANTAISNLTLSAVTASAGQVIGSVSQSNGAVSASLKTLAATDIPDISGNSFTYDTNKTTTIATMASDIDSLDGRLDTLEGDTLDARLDVLEGENLDSRLQTLEAISHFTPTTEFIYPGSQAAITFWNNYNTWKSSLTIVEDEHTGNQYVLQSLVENDYQTGLYYIENSEYDEEDETSSQYIISNDPWDANATYYLPFNTVESTYVATQTNGPALLAAGEPVPQTFTLQEIVERLLALEATVNA